MTVDLTAIAARQERAAPSLAHWPTNTSDPKVADAELAIECLVVRDVPDLLQAVAELTAQLAEADKRVASEEVGRRAVLALPLKMCPDCKRFAMLIEEATIAYRCPECFAADEIHIDDESGISDGAAEPIDKSLINAPDDCPACSGSTNGPHDADCVTEKLRAEVDALPKPIAEESAAALERVMRVGDARADVIAAARTVDEAWRSTGTGARMAVPLANLSVAVDALAEVEAATSVGASSGTSNETGPSVEASVNPADIGTSVSEGMTIDEAVDLWHKAPISVDVSLHDYLGMTYAQYGEWAKTGVLPKGWAFNPAVYRSAPAPVSTVPPQADGQANA